MQTIEEKMRAMKSKFMTEMDERDQEEIKLNEKDRALAKSSWVKTLESGISLMTGENLKLSSRPTMNSGVRDDMPNTAQIQHFEAEGAPDKVNDANFG
jgi:hypothetical protein